MRSAGLSFERKVKQGGLDSSRESTMRIEARGVSLTRSPRCLTNLGSTSRCVTAGDTASNARSINGDSPSIKEHRKSLCAECAVIVKFSFVLSESLLASLVDIVTNPLIAGRYRSRQLAIASRASSSLIEEGTALQHTQQSHKAHRCKKSNEWDWGSEGGILLYI